LRRERVSNEGEDRADVVEAAGLHALPDVVDDPVDRHSIGPVGQARQNRLAFILTEIVVNVSNPHGRQPHAVDDSTAAGVQLHKQTHVFPLHSPPRC